MDSGTAQGAIAQDVADALAREGIIEPTRSRLAGLPGIRAEMVRKAAQKTRATGGGDGAVVRAIENAVEAEAARQRQADARRRAESQQAEANQRRRQSEQATRTKQQRIREYIDALDGETLEREKRAALREMDETARRPLAGRDARKNPVLQHAIYQRRGSSPSS